MPLYNQYLPLAGGTLTGPLRTGTSTAVAVGTVTDPIVSVNGLTANTSTLAVGRWAADGTPPTLRFVKGNSGAVGAYTAIGNATNMASIFSYGANGTAMAIGGQLAFFSTEAWTGSAQGTQFAVSLCPQGSTSTLPAITIDMNTGVFLYNVLTFTAAGILINRSYTVATAPSASIGVGAQIYITNPAAGAKRPYWSDGTNWYDAAGVLLA